MKPIRIHYGIRTPDVVVVVDESLIGAMDVTSGLKDNGILLVNTNQSPEIYRAKLPSFHGKIATVDATQIALDCIGRPIPNIPIMGALIRVSGIVSLEDLEPRLRHKFSAKFSEQVVEGNVKALKRGYEEVKNTVSEQKWSELPEGVVVPEGGNSQDVYIVEGWRTFKPVVNLESARIA